MNALQKEKAHNGRKSCLSIIQHVRKTNLKTVPVAVAAKDTAAYLLFSSGTTGLPKGHLYSIEQFPSFFAQGFQLLKSHMGI
jgi:acyl-coenzyme A synthetase/AMP-(fatty) acid ligase